jgi:hypothetical protein
MAHLNERWRLDGISPEEAGNCELNRGDLIAITGRSHVDSSLNLLRNLSRKVSFSIQYQSETVSIIWPKFAKFQEFASRRKGKPRANQGQNKGKKEPLYESQIHEPKPRRAMASRPEEIPEDLWADFLALRRAKKSPLTVIALAGIEREAKKAGWPLERALRECCQRGWQGFKAEWTRDRSANMGQRGAAGDGSKPIFIPRKIDAETKAECEASARVAARAREIAKTEHIPTLEAHRRALKEAG